MNPLVIWNGLIAICTVATTLYATQRVGTNVVPKYQSLGPPTNLTIGFTPSLDGKYLLDGPSDGLIDQPDSLGGFRPSNVSAELCLVEPMVDPGTLNHTNLVFLQGLIEPSSSDNSILQKQEPTVANPLDQDKHDALTTQLEAIDVARKDAETAVESVDTQVEEAQSLQELKAIENNISDKITPDPETGTEKAQNAVYQAALSTVGDKIKIFETNQRALNTAISELPRIPEQSEKPLSLTQQNEHIVALDNAIKSVDNAKQKPGVQLDNEQNQKIQAQEKRLESLRSTYGQGQQAVKNIRDLTVVDKIGVMTSSDSPNLVEVVNAHKAVVARREQLQSSQTQAAIGLDSGLGQLVEQAINTLDGRRNALEEDYVKLRMEAYKNELTKIQDSGPHSNLLQQVGKALKQAINSIVPGPDKENTSDLIKIKISQLDNEIQAVNAKIQAIQELTIHGQYDDILTKRSAMNLTDESNQESSVPLSGHFAELREQFIAPLKIQKGTLRAQQFEAGLSEVDSDLGALVTSIEQIQSQFKPGMRVDGDETITQGFQEQLSNTLAVYIQPLRKAYTNLATDNEGLINSATRVDSIREMDLIKLETAQADLKLMQKALALKNKGVPILNFNATQLDDALNAVGVAIDVQREYSEMLQKIEESVPKNRDLSSKELLTNIQYIKSKYVDSIFEKFKNAQLTQGDKLKEQLQQKIAAYQDNLVSQYIGTLGDAPRIDVKAWLSGLVGGDVEPADIFTAKQVELLEDFKGSLDRIPLQLKKSVGWPHTDNSKFQPYAIDQLSADQLDTILSNLNNISSDQIVDSMKSISELSQNQTSTHTQLTKKLYDDAVADLKGQVSRQLAQINNVKLEDINGQLMNHSKAFDNLLERNVNQTTPHKDLTAYISDHQEIKQAEDNIAAPQGSDQATTKSTLERKIEEAAGEAKQIEDTLQSQIQDEKNQDAEKKLPLKLLRSILNIDSATPNIETFNPNIETFNLSQCQNTLDRLKAMDRQPFSDGLDSNSRLKKILDGDKGDEIFKGAQDFLESSLDKQIRTIESKKDKSKDIVKRRAKQGFENKLSQIKPSNALERLKSVMNLSTSPGVESLTISQIEEGAYNSALRYLDDNGSSSGNIVGEVRKECIAEVLLKGLPDAINALGNIENMKLGEVKHALGELQTISHMVDEKQLEWRAPSFKGFIIKAQDK